MLVTEIVEDTVSFWVDTKVDFISLVDKGANKSPWRVIKNDTVNHEEEKEIVMLIERVILDKGVDVAQLPATDGLEFLAAMTEAKVSKAEDGSVVLRGVPTELFDPDSLRSFVVKNEKAAVTVVAGELRKGESVPEDAVTISFQKKEGVEEDVSPPEPPTKTDTEKTTDPAEPVVSRETEETEETEDKAVAEETEDAVLEKYDPVYQIEDQFYSAASVVFGLLNQPMMDPKKKKVAVVATLDGLRDSVVALMEQLDQVVKSEDAVPVEEKEEKSSDPTERLSERLRKKADRVRKSAVKKTETKAADAGATLRETVLRILEEAGVVQKAEKPVSAEEKIATLLTKVEEMDSRLQLIAKSTNGTSFGDPPAPVVVEKEDGKRSDSQLFSGLIRR